MYPKLLLTLRHILYANCIAYTNQQKLKNEMYTGKGWDAEPRDNDAIHEVQRSHSTEHETRCHVV